MIKAGKFLLPVFFLSILFSANARANTYTAASCNESDVNAVINGPTHTAVDGDVILVPGGSATWTSSLTVSVGITINGQGCAVTQSGSGQLVVTADSSASFILTGFTFYGSANGGPVSITTSISPVSATFRIYNNTFDDGSPSTQGTMLSVGQNGPGLIDHNSFIAHHGADEVIHNDGWQGPTNYGGWGTNVTPGTSTMLFVENNKFDYPSTDGYFDGTSAMENFYGSQIVFRDNLVENMQLDAHGSSPGTCSGNGNENSTRWWEVYNNTFQVDSLNQSNYTDFRGGSGVVFGNTMTGTNTATGSIEFTEDCTSGTWPLQSQVGRGINTTAGSTGTSGTYSPAYVWGNASSMQIYNGNTTFVQIGTAPTDATNCTGHAGDVCDVVSTTSEPTSFERCESAADVSAGCPVSYTYTPYTYPHPLDNLPANCMGAGCASSSNPPVAPTNLTAVVH